MNAVAEAIKGLLSLIAVAGPFATSRLPILPLLNPQISSDMWVIATLLSVFTGLAIFQLCRSTFQRGRGIFVLIGIGIAVSCFVMMLGVADDLMFSGTPGFQILIVQVAYVIFFIGIAVAAGASFPSAPSKNC